MLATGFSYSAERRTRQVRMISGMLPHVRDLRRAGSAALDLCAVAAGWVDGYVEHGCNWWDWAAAALIATEAGAVVRVPGPTGSTPPDDGLGAGRRAGRHPGHRRRAGRAGRAARRRRGLTRSARSRRPLSRSGRGPRPAPPGRPSAAGPGAVAASPVPAGRPGQLVQRVPGGADRVEVAEGGAHRDVDGVVVARVAHHLGARQHQGHRAGRGLAGRPEPHLADALHVAVGEVRVVVRRGRLGEPEVAELGGHQVRLAALPARVEHPHPDRSRRERRHASSAPAAATCPGTGPATGVGQARSCAGPDALTSTDVQVTSAAAASTVTTAITGPRRRRW